MGRRNTWQPATSNLLHQAANDRDGLGRPQANSGGREIGERDRSMSGHVAIARATFLPSIWRQANTGKRRISASTALSQPGRAALETNTLSTNYTALR